MRDVVSVCTFSIGLNPSAACHPSSRYTERRERSDSENSLILNVLPNFEWQIIDNPIHNTESNLIDMVNQLEAFHTGSATGQTLVTGRYFVNDAYIPNVNNLDAKIVFDVTHSIRKYGIPSADPSGGARQYLDVLARAGVAAGVDGLFVETHPCPNEALCDAASQLDMRNLEEFLKPLLELHAVEVNYRNNI